MVDQPGSMGTDPLIMTTMIMINPDTQHIIRQGKGRNEAIKSSARAGNWARMLHTTVDLIWLTVLWSKPGSLRRMFTRFKIQDS